MTERFPVRLAMAVLAVALGAATLFAASCGGRGGEPMGGNPRTAQAIREGLLVESPAAVVRVCRSSSAGANVPVLCPAAVPRGDGGWGRARALDRTSCEYLIDVEPGGGRGAPARFFHLLFGGRCNPFDLGVRNGKWPARGFIRNDLRLVGIRPLKPGQSGRGLPARPRVLGRLRVAQRPALLLRHAPHPLTSVHTGHLAIVWNEASAGYVISGHLPEPVHHGAANAPSERSERQRSQCARRAHREGGDRSLPAQLRRRGPPGEIGDLFIAGPPWALTLLAHFDDRATAPDGTELYSNRVVLLVRTRWGRIVHQEDFYEDTGRIVELERRLRELGVEPARDDAAT